MLLCAVWTGCSTLAPIENTRPLPHSYPASTDSINSAKIKWKDFFADQYLATLIDTALKNNLDLLTALQNIEIVRNEAKLGKGLLFPSISGGAALAHDKVGRYTSEGAGDAVTEITPGKLVPDPLNDLLVGVQASWEVDVWKKLRNTKKAALARYLAGIEGKNFVVTNLVAEIANSYYELLSLDNELEIIRETIRLQKNVLETVKIQKDASVVTELAVKKFEAEVLSSQGMEFEVLQRITETENKVNFLLGRYPQPIARGQSTFIAQSPPQIHAGIPSQLLSNRPDIRQAELELSAARCDVKAARAAFYPSLNLSGSLGFRAFSSHYLFYSPQSLAYSLVGDLSAPLVNRSAIKAEFNKAKAYQVEAMYDYQKAVLNGFMEVSNELSNINNLERAYDLKSKEVETRTKSIAISNDLFKSGRADYLEVLITQRDVLESKLGLVETRKRQFNAITNIYQALGGGWD